MTIKEAMQKTFPHFREWLMFWCKIHKDMRHIEYSNKRFFYGNSSYMDLGELLRQNEGLESSPCVIYDTDVHLSRTQNTRVLTKHHSFYICVLTDTQIDGEEVKRAKDRCEMLALELMAWFDGCKAETRGKMIGWDMGNVDSTTPFLNGWEAVAMRMSQPVSVPCVNEQDYVLN